VRGEIVSSAHIIKNNVETDAWRGSESENESEREEQKQCEQCVALKREP
jgi:hypothetical protein